MLSAAAGSVLWDVLVLVLKKHGNDIVGIVSMLTLLGPTHFVTTSYLNVKRVKRNEKRTENQIKSNQIKSTLSTNKQVHLDHKA
jgi:hypothetical protein